MINKENNDKYIVRDNSTLIFALFLLTTLHVGFQCVLIQNQLLKFKTAVLEELKQKPISLEKEQK